jgi:acetolactate synthase-1/3 small subunit
MRHTISVLVENKFGVLTRVAGLFSGRGYNIDSLNVAPTHDATLSRMTIVTRGDDATVEQICKQLGKLVDSVKVIDYSKTDYIDRELVLVKVAANGQNRAEICQMAELFRAKVVNVQSDNLVIEITGAEGKINQFLTLLKDFGILDLTRTGVVALPRS